MLGNLARLPFSVENLTKRRHVFCQDGRQRKKENLRHGEAQDSDREVQTSSYLFIYLFIFEGKVQTSCAYLHFPNKP